MKKIQEMKLKTKDLGKELRELKASRKQDVRKRSLWEIELDITSLKRVARHHHIAYCEMRGTPYEAIEHKCNIKPNRDYIEEIKERYKEDEVICTDS